MTEPQTEQLEEKNLNVIEDLTLDEADTANIKGGPTDYLLELEGIKGESRSRT